MRLGSKADVADRFVAAGYTRDQVCSQLFVMVTDTDAQAAQIAGSYLGATRASADDVGNAAAEIVRAGGRERR
jgi:hypothetical protein